MFVIRVEENYEQDRHCTYERNIEARSRDHCCRGKAISIRKHILSVCLCQALGIQLEMRVRRIVMFGLLDCIIFFHFMYEGWNFNSGNYLFTTDTK